MNSLPDTEGDPTTETSRPFPMSAVHGRCHERFAAIKAIAEQLAVEGDDGFALAVELDGQLVVDLWVGRAREASLIHTFSTVKPLSACALLLLGTLPASVMEVVGTGRDLVIGEEITWTLGSAQLDTGGGIGMGGLGGSFAGAIPEHGVTWSFLPLRVGDFSRVESIESSLLRQISG